MAPTDYVFMEVLTGKTHLEAEKLLHINISQTNTFTGIVPWPPYFLPFRLTNGEEFRQPSLFLLQLYKNIPGFQKLVFQQDAHTFNLCGHTSAYF